MGPARPVQADQEVKVSRALDSERRLPNLFIVGAPKCGTTAWVEYLRTHPEIFFTKHKEHCYFAFDLPNFRLTSTAAGYAELFAECGDAKVVGEASVMYLFSEAAAAAIRQHDPASKILIFLRDQEDLLPSLHNQFLWEFAEEIEDFETVWRLSGQRPQETVPAACLEPRTLDYKAMGDFRRQVERYLANFPADQVRIIRYRQWTGDPRSTYLDILDFLGLEDDGRTDFPPINQGMQYRWRGLARLIVGPRSIIRRGAQFLVRRTGHLGRRVAGVVRKAVSLLWAPGYNSDIGPKLRDEIRRYYAEDNRLLEERLREVSAAP
jgi:hypothetical protein